MFDPLDLFLIPPHILFGQDDDTEDSDKKEKEELHNKVKEHTLELLMDILEASSPDDDHTNMILAVRKHKKLHKCSCEIMERFVLPDAEGATPEKRAEAVKCLNDMLKLAEAFLAKE